MSNLYVNTINPAAGTKVSVAAAETHISGNLCVTGTLHAKLTDFVVSANSTTLGDEASDAITINAATASIPNSLTFDAGTLHLDAPNNRVGIGTTSPALTFHVVRDAATRSAGALLYASNQPVIIEDDNRPGIQLIGSANNIGIIEFADDSHANAGSINFDHSTDRLRFGFADDAEKIYFDTFGNVFTDGGLRSTSQLLELATGASGTPSGDAGIIIERGSSSNAALLWDESRDEFVFCTTSATGSHFTGKDLSFTAANLSVDRLGAGTEQAQAKIHARQDSSSGTLSSNAVVIIEDDSRPAMQFVGNANNIALIQFGDNAAMASGQLYYDHSSDKFRFDAGGVSDRLTISDSAIQANSTLTVGVDDTGYDVKFFGASASHFMLWDESADELVLAQDSKLSFHDAAGGESILATADGTLQINAGTTLDVNVGTTIDIDAPFVQIGGGGSNQPVLTLFDATNDANAAKLTFKKERFNSGFVAGQDGDVLGAISWQGHDDAPADTIFCVISGSIVDASNSSEDGKLSFKAMTDGVQKEYLNMTGRTSTFTGALEVTGTVTQLKVSYDSDSYATFAVGNASHTIIASAETGNLTLDSGADIILDAAGDDISFKKDGTLRGSISVGTADELSFKDSNGTEIFTIEGASEDRLQVSGTFRLGTGSTVYTILDDDTMGANADNALATQQSIKAYVDASVTAQDLDIIVGGSAYTVDLDSQSLTVTGTYGEVDVAMSGQTMTLGLPNNVEIDGTLTVATGILPDAQDGAYLGSSTKQWSDLFLADGGVISFGDDNEVTLTHTADTGLELMSVSPTTSHLTTPLTITAQSTGAPNAFTSGGFGPSIRFKAETAAGTPGNIEHVGFVGFGALSGSSADEEFAFLVGNIERTGATGSANVMTASMAVTRGASSTSLYLRNDDNTHFSGFQVRHSDGVTTIGGGTSERFVMQGASGHKNSVVAITAGTTNSDTTGDAGLSFAVENIDSREQWSMGVDHSDSLKFKIVTGSVSSFNTAAASYMEFGSSEVVINENGESRDFRVEGDTDSHLLWVDGSGDCVSIGSNTSTPSGVLTVTGDSSIAKPALVITHAEDANNAVDITADSVTTAKVLNISADGLTTGAALYVDMNGSSTSQRSVATIISNNSAAHSASVMVLQNDVSDVSGLSRQMGFGDLEGAVAAGVGGSINFQGNPSLKIGSDNMNLNMYQYDGVLCAAAVDGLGYGGFIHKKTVTQVSGNLNFTSGMTKTTAPWYSGGILKAESAFSSAGVRTITLPTATNTNYGKQLIGWTTRVIYTHVGESNVKIVRGDTGSDSLTGLITSAAGDSNAAAGVTVSSHEVTFVAGTAVPGDYVDITCVWSDASNTLWHVSGMAST